MGQNCRKIVKYPPEIFQETLSSSEGIFCEILVAKLSTVCVCKSDTIQAEKPVQAEEKTNEMFKTYFDRITDPGSNDPMLPTNTCLCIQVS